MTELADYLLTLFSEPLSVLVFLVVFVGVAAAGMRFLSSTKNDLASPPRSLRIDFESSQASASPPSRALLDELATRSAESIRTSAERTPGTGGNARIEFRHVMGAIHRGFSWIVVTALAAATIVSYLKSAPHDGSRLVPWVLLIVTLIAGLHLHNRNRRFGNPTDDAELRADFRRTIEKDLSNKIAAALTEGGQVRWDVGPAEVHNMDRETLDQARALAVEGWTMDEVCRAIKPKYEGWILPHQQAFEAVVRAAIKHGS